MRSSPPEEILAKTVTLKSDRGRVREVVVHEGSTVSFTYSFIYLFIYGARTHRSQANILHRICQILSKYSVPWSLKFDVFRQG